MQGEIHEGPGLKYLTVLPDGYDPEAAYPCGDHAPRVRGQHA